jgi:hypothetical protein
MSRGRGTATAGCAPESFEHPFGAYNPDGDVALLR